ALESVGDSTGPLALVRELRTTSPSPWDAVPTAGAGSPLDDDNLEFGGEATLARPMNIPAMPPATESAAVLFAPAPPRTLGVDVEESAIDAPWPDASELEPAPIDGDLPITAAAEPGTAPMLDGEPGREPYLTATAADDDAGAVPT